MWLIVLLVLSHHQLCRRVSESIKSIHKSFLRDKKIAPFIMTWPSTPIIDDYGKRIDNPCILELPDDQSKWTKLMLKAIDRTDAYALLLIEQREKDVRAILETTEGARCWLMPIAHSGDVTRLGVARITNDRECLGLLWQKNKAEA